MNTVNKLHEAASFIQKRVRSAEIAVVLGSGQGAFAASLEDPLYIAYKDIPNFKSSSVSGHDGSLVFGRMEGREVVVMQGRVHCYEGYSASEAAFGVLCLAFCGTKKFVLTNAAGCLNPAFKVGDLMLIEDHISLFCEDPSRGPHDPELGDRFYSQVEPYNLDIINRISEAAPREGPVLRRGVYCYLPGPRYESKSDIKALRVLGADAIGMSTVPEVLALRNFGISNITGISLLTNYAAGINSSNPRHEDVLTVANAAKEHLEEVLRKLVLIM